MPAHVAYGDGDQGGGGGQGLREEEREEWESLPYKKEPRKATFSMYKKIAHISTFETVVHVVLSLFFCN